LLHRVSHSDFEETYASTLRWATLCEILAKSALDDLEVESADISAAFLSGEIDAEIYMKQPEGFPQGSPDQVLHLLKAILLMSECCVVMIQVSIVVWQVASATGVAICHWGVT
jgi:hypothetical protein